LRIGETFAMAGGNGALQAEVIFEDCRIPFGNRLGGDGDGFRIAMAALDSGRICWAAYCVGAGTNLLDMSVAHLLKRRQFGAPLAQKQGLQWILADLAADLHAARLVCYDAAVHYEREPDRRASLGAMACSLRRRPRGSALRRRRLSQRS